MKTKMKDKIKTQLKEIYRSAYKCKHKKEIAGAILAVLVLSWCVCSCHTSGTKAMIIDFARVQQEAEAYKAIMTEQRSYEEKLQAQFSIEAGTLQKEEESLLEQKKKLGDSAFKKKADELQKKALDLQQKYRYQAQQILAASQAAATKLQPEVEKAVEKAAHKAGAGVVYNKEVTIYNSDSNDMTDTFIKELNRSVKPVEYPDPTLFTFNEGAR